MSGDFRLLHVDELYNPVRRPFSAGERIMRRQYAKDPRRDSLLRRGVVGEPPPLIREVGVYAVAEVEQLLGTKEKELTSLKWKLARAVRKNAISDDSIARLTKEGSQLRACAAQDAEERDKLRHRVTELQETIKRKGFALKAAAEIRDKAAEESSQEISKALGRLKELQTALSTEKGRIHAFNDRAEYAETRVCALEVKLQDSRNQVGEAKRVAAGEAAKVASAHTEDRNRLAKEIVSVEHERERLKRSLEDSIGEIRRRQETAEASEKVIGELQRWRERVLRGDVLEMSPAEVKRLRLLEEQVEALKETNASLRSRLQQSVELLRHAEYDFDKVNGGLRNAVSTVADLSERLTEKDTKLENIELGLKRSKSEAKALKKRATSLQVELGRSIELNKGRLRAVEATTKGMEALVTARQEATEARWREAKEKRQAERAARKFAGKLKMLRRRIAQAEGCSQEFDVERRLLQQQVLAARRGRQSIPQEVEQHMIDDTNFPGGGTEAGPAPTSWKQMTRTLLERAISDWSVKHILVRSDPRPETRCPTTLPMVQELQRGGRRTRAERPNKRQQQAQEKGGYFEHGVDRAHISPANRKISVQSLHANDGYVPELSSASSSSSSPSSGGGMIHDTPGHARYSQRESEDIRRTRTPAEDVGADPPRGGGLEQVDNDGDETPTLDVARVYQGDVRNTESRDRGGRWRWDLVLTAGSSNETARGQGAKLLAILGLQDLGQSLQNLGKSPGDGVKTALCAVARTFNTLLLTRNLAAKQCAEVRGELAAALARLSSRAYTVVEARTACRAAERANRQLVMRLIDAEIGSWVARERSNASVYRSDTVNEPTEAEAAPPCRHRQHKAEHRDRKSARRQRHADGSDRTCSMAEETHATDTTDSSSQTTGETSHTSASDTGRRFVVQTEELRKGKSRDGEARLQELGRRPRSLGAKLELPRVETASRPVPADGITLRLSNVGICDETLHKVVERFRYDDRRRARNQTQDASHFGTAEDGGRQLSLPLSRLLLRGNRITDAGAFALCQLVQESTALVEIGLSENFISQEGVTALHKALANNPCVKGVTVEECEARKGHPRGTIVRAQRRQPTTVEERARAYAYMRIPSSRPRTNKENTSFASEVVPAASLETKGRGVVESGDSTGCTLGEGDLKSRGTKSNQENLRTPETGSGVSNGCEYASAFDGSTCRHGVTTKKIRHEGLHLVQDEQGVTRRAVRMFPPMLIIDLRGCRPLRQIRGSMRLAASSLQEDNSTLSTRPATPANAKTPTEEVEEVTCLQDIGGGVERENSTEEPSGNMDEVADHCANTTPPEKMYLHDNGEHHYGENVSGKRSGSAPISRNEADNTVDGPPSSILALPYERTEKRSCSLRRVRARRRRRRPVSISRRERVSTLTQSESEANDVQELTFLLNMSRGMFSGDDGVPIRSKTQSSLRLTGATDRALQASEARQFPAGSGRQRPSRLVPKQSSKINNGDQKRANSHSTFPDSGENVRNVRFAKTRAVPDDFSHNSSTTDAKNSRFFSSDPACGEAVRRGECDSLHFRRRVDEGPVQSILRHVGEGRTRKAQDPAAQSAPGFDVKRTFISKSQRHVAQEKQGYGSRGHVVLMGGPTSEKNDEPSDKKGKIKEIVVRSSDASGEQAKRGHEGGESEPSGYFTNVARNAALAEPDHHKLADMSVDEASTKAAEALTGEDAKSCQADDVGYVPHGANRVIHNREELGTARRSDLESEVPFELKNADSGNLGTEWIASEQPQHHSVGHNALQNLEMHHTAEDPKCVTADLAATPTEELTTRPDHEGQETQHGWRYDGETSAWYYVTGESAGGDHDMNASSQHEQGDHGGWRYDEHSRSWHYPAGDVSNPWFRETAPSNTVEEGNESIKEGRYDKEQNATSMRHSEMFTQHSKGSESDTNTGNRPRGEEAGALTVERIRVLELALESR